MERNGKKTALFAFNGDPMCFIHVLLNAQDLADRGHEVRLVIEGSATALVGPLREDQGVQGQLYRKLVERGLVHCVCHACARKTGGLASAEEQGLPLCGDMQGHPSMGAYLEEGFEIMTF